MPDVRKRSKPIEKRMRDGTVKQFIRVYDQDDGCSKFEEGQQTRVRHRSELYNDSMGLDEAHAREMYEQTGKMVFGDVAKKGVLRAKDLGLVGDSSARQLAQFVSASAQRHGSSGLVKVDTEEEEKASQSDAANDDGSHSSSEDEEAPL